MYGGNMVSYNYKLMRSTLLVTMNSLWFMAYWRIFFKRRLCALWGIYVGTRVSINCRCLIKFCWWLEEAAMCRDVHRGLHDLCCHARFFPNSCTLLSIDAQLLEAQLCRNSRFPFRSEWHRASYWFIDGHMPLYNDRENVCCLPVTFVQKYIKNNFLLDKWKHAAWCFYWSFS